MVSQIKQFDETNIVSLLNTYKHKLFVIKVKESKRNTKTYYLSRHILGIGNKEKVFSKKESKTIETLIKNQMLRPIYDEFHGKHASCQAFH